MKGKQIAAVFFTALIAGASVSALAADNQGQLDKSSPMTEQNMGAGMMSNETNSNKADVNGKHMGRSMMRGGMMGNGMMGGMMHSMMGNGMMGGSMMGGGAMGGGMGEAYAMAPQLPAGNEKLQLKMQAEIMQKVGDIIAKYADQIVTNKDSAQ